CSWMSIPLSLPPIVLLRTNFWLIDMMPPWISSWERATAQTAKHCCLTGKRPWSRQSCLTSMRMLPLSARLPCQGRPRGSAARGIRRILPRRGNASTVSRIGSGANASTTSWPGPPNHPSHGGGTPLPSPHGFSRRLFTARRFCTVLGLRAFHVCTFEAYAVVSLSVVQPLDAHQPCLPGWPPYHVTSKKTAWVTTLPRCLTTMAQCA